MTLDYINFSLDIDYYEVIQEDNSLMVLDVYIVSDGLNLNNSIITKSSIDNAIPSLANKPFIYRWDKSKKDFLEHSRNKQQKESQERAMGNFPESNNARFEEYKGKNFLVANVVIWKMYTPVEVIDKIKKQEQFAVSMEISVTKHEKNDDGKMIVNEFIFNSVCCLGLSYHPGIENANAQVIKFSETYASLVNKYNHLYSAMMKSYSIPTDVLYNIRESLKTKQTNVNIIKYAKTLLEKKRLSYNEAKILFNKITKTKKPENLNFYGGEEAKFWLESIITNNEGGEPMAIEIKNGKEFAITGEWKNPGEEFYSKILDSDDLLREAYVFVNDGYVDSPESNLQFLHHCFSEDGSLVVHAGGLQETENALVEMAKENKEGLEDAFAHLNKHRKDLGLEEIFIEKKEDIDFSVSLNNRMKLINYALKDEKDEYGWQRYYLVDLDDEYIYVFDFSIYEFSKISYKCGDEKASVDFTNRTAVLPLTKWTEVSGGEDSQNEFAKFAQFLTEKVKEAHNTIAEKETIINENKDKVQEYDQIKSKFDQMNQDFNSLNTELESLREYRNQKIQEEKQIFANDLYDQYAEFVTENDIKEFNKLLEQSSKEEFVEKFSAEVLPRLKNKIDSSKQKPDGNKNGIDFNKIIQVASPKVEEGKQHKGIASTIKDRHGLI